jgi:hypothetical protein
MRLGLSLGLGGTGGARSSLYTTANMTKELDVAYSDIIDGNSFRLARFTSVGSLQGRLIITGIPSGAYRLTGVISSYDGAQTGITTRQIRVMNDFAVLATITAAGAFDQTLSITSGTLRFDAGGDARGARWDDFFMVAS